MGWATWRRRVRRMAGYLLHLEIIPLLAALYFFWWPSNYPFSLSAPVDRVAYTWLLWFFPAFLLNRWVAVGRLWTRTPLDVWLIGLIIIGFLNAHIAPYPTRGDFMLMRPLLGIWLVVYLMELARQHRRIQVPLALLTLFCLVTGVVALLTTQWVDKAGLITSITRSLPRTDALRPFITSFNPNEIAGALTWLVPLAAGIALYPWSKPAGRAVQVSGGVAFALLFTALFLGQSRFAIAGVLTALGIITLAVVPRGALRYGALAVLGGVVLLQAALLFNLLPAPGAASANTGSADTAGLSARDESSFTRRFDIWRSGIAIVGDHPLSGAGINMFRLTTVRGDYPVITYDYQCPPTSGCPRVLPHAHNELIQIGADMGVPGILVFLGWHGAVAVMLWRAWQHRERGGTVIAAAVAGGLVAHFFYGMGDAITLWDRFAFVHWLLIGLAAAQYGLTRYNAVERSAAAKPMTPHRRTADAVTPPTPAPGRPPAVSARG